MQRLLLIAALTLTASFANALGPNDDPVKFQAYKDRLAARRYNSLVPRQQRALAHQASLRANYNPDALIQRATNIQYAYPLVDYNGPPVIYMGRGCCGCGSLNRLSRAVERLSEND